MNDFIRRYWQKRYWQIGLQILAAILAGGFIVLGLRRTIPVPDLVVVGSVGVRMYSLVMIITVVTAIAYTRWLLQQHKLLKSVDVWELFLYVLIPGIIGARFYHVLTEWYLYVDEPVRSVALWTGGLSIVGGMVGGLVGLIWFSRRQKLPVVELIGVAVLVLPVAQIIGRLGNFFNRELYGLPTDVPWAMYVEPQYRYGIFSSEDYYHPLFLYEMVANLLLWLILLYLWKSPNWKAHLVKVYVIGYAGIRYVLDFARIEYKPIWGLSYTQLVVLGVLAAAVVFGLGYQVWHRRRYGIWFTQHKS